MFEKIVHQIWLQGVENIPESYRRGLESINKYTPNWIHKIWDEIDILNLLRQYPEYLHVYYKLAYLHQKVDFSRYVILYVYGGIYIDMDVELIKN
jgi:inositol phosphorylceramide mannosyltransferase catalytic subunit